MWWQNKVSRRNAEAKKFNFVDLYSNLCPPKKISDLFLWRFVSYKFLMIAIQFIKEKSSLEILWCQVILNQKIFISSTQILKLLIYFWFEKVFNISTEIFVTIQNLSRFGDFWQAQLFKESRLLIGTVKINLNCNFLSSLSEELYWQHENRIYVRKMLN